MTHLDIDLTALSRARTAGEHGMAISLECATKADPLFKAKAETAILRHLRNRGPDTGEFLVDIAKAYGAVPAKGDRSFGGVFKSLLHRNLIRVVGYVPRTKGHGCSGGKLYAAVV